MRTGTSRLVQTVQAARCFSKEEWVHACASS
jgi:hypothetical protein